MWTLERVPFAVACVVARYIAAPWIDADLVCAHLRPTLVMKILQGAADRCQDCVGAFGPYQSRYSMKCGCNYHATCFMLQNGYQYSHPNVCRQRTLETLDRLQTLQTLHVV